MEQLQQRNQVMEALAGIDKEGPAISNATAIQSAFRRRRAMCALGVARVGATRVQSTFRGRRDRRCLRGT
eukprot:184104-Prymnesium_polylepis.1